MKQFIITLLVLTSSAFLKAQTNVDYVRDQYPDVYLDIYNTALSKYKGMESLIEKDVQEQVFAFLYLAESNEVIEDAIMTEALLRWSKNGEQAHNRAIIEDLSIENPFPQLRCDWVFARLHYNSSKGGMDGDTKQNTKAVKPVKAVSKQECADCPHHPNHGHQYRSGEPKLVALNVATPVKEEVRCTAHGECVACKSSNKSRDFCSHLTSDYVQLLNQRYSKRTINREKVYHHTPQRAFRQNNETESQELDRSDSQYKYKPQSVYKRQTRRVRTVSKDAQSSNQETQKQVRKRSFNNNQF